MRLSSKWYLLSVLHKSIWYLWYRHLTWWSMDKIFFCCSSLTIFSSALSTDSLSTSNHISKLQKATSTTDCEYLLMHACTFIIKFFVLLIIWDISTCPDHQKFQVTGSSAVTTTQPGCFVGVYQSEAVGGYFYTSSTLCMDKLKWPKQIKSMDTLYGI